MIRCIFISLLLVLQLKTIAQNLVPNPSFEQLKLCPTYKNLNITGNHIERFCEYWENVGVLKLIGGGSGGSYLHECASAGNSIKSLNAIPLNNWGFQFANKGKAFVTLTFFGTNAENSSQFYSVKLNKPLKTGRKYTLQFYANLADSSKSSINNIGMLLSTQKLIIADFRQFNNHSMPNRAHLYSKELITDKENWIKIEGTIIADSSYEYLTIGNFFDFDKTLNSDPSMYWDLMVFIDDVSVEETVKYIAAAEKVICKGTSATLSALGADENFFWSTNKSDTLSIANEIEYTPSTSSFIYLISTNGIDSSYIQVIDPPVKVVQDSVELCENYSIHVNAYQPNAFAYYLNDSPTESEFYINSSALYIIKTEAGNCFRMDSMVVYSCETNLYIPNAFTPNGDGTNDVFLPKGTQVFNYKLNIYNRWGQSIFESTDINRGWTGNEASADTYFYTIYYENSDGSKTFDKRGIVNLIR